jgi:hypothetical protein
MPTRGRVDEQDPQLRGRLVLTHAEHAADPLAVKLRDPRRLAIRVVIDRVVGDDLGDERLEVGVPAELAVVLLTVRHHHPAEVAGAVQRANDRLVVTRQRGSFRQCLEGLGTTLAP